MFNRPRSASRFAALGCVALAVIVAGWAGGESVASAAPSSGLAHVLSEIRDMLSLDFGHLREWANRDHPMPENPAFSLEKTEADILNLSPGDRDAVLEWLQGKGRIALHNAGASDSDIGPARPGIDSPQSLATPNAWRNVPLATASLDAVSPGKIQILGGFAAVKRDGTSAIACVSFKNLDPRVAKRVVFEFPFLGDGASELGKITLDRNGEFSPNVDIRSFESMSGWQNGGVGPAKSFADSCVRRDLPTPALPFLQARAVGYRVVHVDYTDGTAWAVPAAPAPPAQ